jgi:hypothetical protein
MPISSLIDIDQDRNSIYLVSNNYLYVINKSTGNIISTINMSQNINDMDVVPNKNTIYVADGNYINIIDANTNTVVCTITAPTANTVYYVAFNPNTNQIFAYQDPDHILVYDGNTNSLISCITTGSVGSKMKVNLNNNELYIPLGSNQLGYVDPSDITQLAGSVTVGTDPSGVDYSCDRS